VISDVFLETYPNIDVTPETTETVKRELTEWYTNTIQDVEAIARDKKS
jgi:hypothetical protein